MLKGGEKMNQKVTIAYIYKYVYRIHTKTGNCYLLEKNKFYLAVQIQEKGQLIWKKYKEMPYMTVNRNLLSQIETCYNKNGNKIVERRKGSTELTVISSKEDNKKRSQLVSAS